MMDVSTVQIHPLDGLEAENAESGMCQLHISRGISTIPNQEWRPSAHTDFALINLRRTEDDDVLIVQTCCFCLFACLLR